MTVQKKTDGETKQLPALGMVGRCFIIWGDKGSWQYQGVVRGEPAPGFYLCQYFECLMGELSTLAVFPLEKFMDRPWREPGSILFEDDKHMRFWQEHVYRSQQERALKEAAE
jgi:hypothetical protein